MLANPDPNVSVSKRDKPLDQTLYEDAERRRREHLKLKEDLDNSRAKPKEKQYKNEKSDKYLVKRFDRDFEEIKQFLHDEAS